MSSDDNSDDEISFSEFEGFEEDEKALKVKSASDLVLDFIDEHGNEVLRFETFALLPQLIVHLLLSRKKLCADEFIKFEAALKWSRKYCESHPDQLLKEVFGNFLHYIQFHKIPAGILLMKIYPLGIIPFTVIIKAFICKILISPNNPQGFWVISMASSDQHMLFIRILVCFINLVVRAFLYFYGNRMEILSNRIEWNENFNF